MNIYEKCPILENENFILRLFQKEDCDDLLKVYSDKMALPFFNSDNCDGDNFYYDTLERMKEVISFWQMAYDNRWFSRLSIVDKKIKTVIGTVEVCLRVSDDFYNNMGILRIDVRSDYENEEPLFSIFSIITPVIEELLECKGILTKAPIYAVERIKALKKIGFFPSKHYLVGKNNYQYDGYWMIK